MAKKVRKSKKKYTLSEFKAWLEGVEELQPANWSPDVDQWKLIRDKIDSIVEPEPEEQYITHTISAPHPSPLPMSETPERRQPPMQQPTALPLDEPGFTPPPTGLSDVEMSPAARAVLNGGDVPTSMVPPTMKPDANGRLKTPDINTADGNYDSSFT